MRAFLSFLFLSFLPVTGAAPQSPAFSATTPRAAWKLEIEGGDPLLTVTPQDGIASFSAPLVRVDGDPEIRELPDGSVVPAVAYRGELDSCSVSVDIALGNEGAWVALHDCLPDAPLPGGWTGLLLLAPVARIAWTGEWTMTDRGTDASLDITAAGKGRLRVFGLATREVSATSIHYGEFEITSMPEGDRMILDAAEESLAIDPGSGCRVALQLAAGSLIVEDNGRCGGRGVRFDGVYVRKRK